MKYLSKISIIACIAYFLLYSSSFTAQAQSTGFGPPSLRVDTASYMYKTASVLSSLDKSKVPTGILYTKVFPFAHFWTFNGSAPSDTSSSALFTRANFELYNSNVRSTNTLISSPTFDSNVLQAQSNGYVPIGIISHDYSDLDSLAVKNGGLAVTNKKLVETNNGYNIYVQKHLFTSSFVTPSETLHSGTISCKIDASISTIEKSINYVSIYIDGQFIISTQLNTQFSITVTQIGEHLLQTIAFYTDGTHDSAWSSFNVVQVSSSQKSSSQRTSGSVSPDIVSSITGYTFDSNQYPGAESSSIFGSPSTNRATTGTVAIYFANPQQSTALRKPVIILDGFDPTNARGYNELYNDNFNTLGQADNLRSKGYDIVIVDYNEGGGLIERNAMLLLKVIDNLYSQYSSTLQSDFIVAGPSMGSLVAQYALKYAELKGKPHHTKEFISLDGIHNGANVPLGIQFVYKRIHDYFANEIAIIKFFNNGYDVLNTPAAKQMLLAHYSGGSNTPHPFRNTFLNNLSSLGGNGYPTTIANVAITNGSNNTQTPGLPGTEFYNLKHKDLFDIDILRARFKSMPISGQSEVGYLYIYYHPLLILAGLSGTYRDYAQGNNNYSLDVLPGSYTDTFDKLPNDKDTDLFAGFLGHINGHLTYYPCFVPSTSSVDLRLNSNHSFIPSYNWYQEDIVCNGKTPFIRVYTPKFNQSHVEVKSIFVALANEIAGTFDPFKIPAPEVTTNKEPCPNNPITAHVITSPNTMATSFTWEFNSNEMTIDNSSSSPYITNSPDVTIVLIANQSIAHVKLNTSCGDSKPANVDFGLGLGYITVSNPEPFAYDQLTASIAPYPNVSNFDWYLNGTLIYQNAGNTVSFSPAGNYLKCGDNRIQVIANLTCGQIYSNEMNEGELTRLCYGYRNATLYPNPATSYTQLLDEDEHDGNYSYLKGDICVYNSKGKRLTDISIDSKGKMDTSKLPSGIYLVKIVSSGKSVTKRLVIE